MSAPPRIERTAAPRAALGEGAIWCDRTRRLWWVDIARRELHRFDPEAGRDERWDMPGAIGCAALTEGDDLVVALTGGLHRFSPATGAPAHLADLPGEPEGNRPNDGAVSRGGRFFVGTMPQGDRSRATGRLHVFDGREVACRVEGLHVANGLAFSPDDRTAYLSDSWPGIRTIWAFDHEDGALSRRRVFFDTRATAGRPDGASVDVDGCYWMAGVGGAELLRLTPRGEVDLRIELPVARPTRPCFGGPDLRTLYLTSIGEGAAEDAPDGALLAIETGHQGLPEPRLRGV